MSSPIHHAKDLDAALIYAPPWAREERPAAPLVPDAAPDGELAPPCDSDDGDRPFSGDVALMELQRRMALDPQEVPAPPRLKRARSMGLIALRVCAVTGAAAFIAWAAVSLPGTRLSPDETASAGSAAPTMSAASGRQDQLPIAAPEQTRAPAQAVETAPPPPQPPPLDSGRAAAASEAPLPQPQPQPADGGGHAAVSEPATSPPQAAADRGRSVVNEPLHLQPRPPTAIKLQQSQVAMRLVVPPPPTIAPPAQPPEEKVVLRLDDGEMAVLLKRGQDYLKDGDIVSARLLLRRAAEGGSASAALILGETFDPAVIQKLGAIGISANAAKARQWYRKAEEMGSRAASQQLARLAQSP